MQELIYGLRDGRAAVRAESAAALGALGADAIEAAGWLAVAVRDTEAEVRKAAIDALVAIDIDALPFVIAAVAESLMDPDQSVQDAAEIGVLGVGEDGLEALVGSLDRSSAAAMKRLIPTLLKRADAVEVFALALRHPLVTVRINSALGLFQLALNGVQEAEPWLAKAKSDDVAEVRAAANNALTSLQSGSRPPAVFEPDPIRIGGFEERLLTGEALAEAADKELIDRDRMVLALRDGRPHVRANAARALGLLGPAAGEAAGWLALVVRDPEPEVRRAAIEGLGGIQASGIPMVVAAMVRALSDPDEAVAAAAGEVMESVAGDSLDAMITGLDTDPKTARKTILPLILRRDDAAPVLGRALGSPLVTVRINAALGLFELGCGDEANTDAAQFLQVAREDPVQEVREAAKNALKLLQDGDGPPKFFEPQPIDIAGFEERALSSKLIAAAVDKVDEARMLLALRDGREHVRANACRALAALGPKAQQSSGWLALTMKDPEPLVRAAAVGAMHAVTPVPLPMTVRSLVQALQDPDSRVADAAEEVLAQLSDAPADALIAGLDTDPGTARRATLPLILAREDRRALLGRALAAPEVPIRVNAAQALFDLAKEGDVEAEQLLGQAEHDPSAEVRDATKSAIAGLVTGPPKPIVYEPEPIDVPGFEERPLSAKALAKVADKSSVDRLMRSLSDGREVVRRNAAAALGVFGAAAAPALGWLAMSLRDTDDAVRAAALGAIKLIGGEPTPLLVRAIVRALNDPSPQVQTAAEAAVELIASGPPGALVEGLDTDPRTARRAILHHILARPDNSAVLGKALQHRLPTVRVNAAFGLRDLVEGGDDAATAYLTVAEGDPERSVRDAAAGIDPQSGGGDADDLLLDATPLPSESFAREPLTVAELEALADLLDVSLLRRTLFDGRSVVRENSARALGVLAVAGCGGDLFLACKDADPRVAAAARKALERVPDGADALVEALAASPTMALPILAARADAIQVLERAREHGNPYVSHLSMATLAELEAADDDVEPERLLAVLDLPPVPVPGFDQGPLDTKALAAAAKADSVSPTRLAHALSDKRPVVRRNAAALLGALGEAAAPVVGWLAPALADPEHVVREAAAQALAVIPAPALPLVVRGLVAALFDSEASVAKAARTALEGMADGPAAALVEGLDSDPNTAKGTILPLLLRRDDASALLGRALQSPRTQIRMNAAMGLYEKGQEGDELASVFLGIAALDPAPTVRMAAQGIVESDLPPKPPQVTDPEPFPVDGFDERILPWPTLQAARKMLDRSRMYRALEDGRAVVRINAVRGLGLVGEGSDVPALLLAARDADAAVRTAADEAFDRLGGAGPALVNALRDSPQPALAQLVRRDDCAELLEAGAAHDNSRISAVAAAALAELNAARATGDADLFVAVLEGLPLPSPAFAERALSDAELDKVDADVGRLLRLLSDGRQPVRRNAAAALGRRGAGAVDAAGWLAVALRDPDGDVRTAAVRALVKVGGTSLPLVTGALIRGLSDVYDEVRAAAADALVVVEGEVVRQLIDALDCEPVDAFDTVLPVIWARQDRTALLTAAVADGRNRVRVNGAFGLFRHALDGDSQVDAAMTVARTDPNAAVRDAAMGGLAWLLGQDKQDEAADADPVPFDGFEERLLTVAQLTGHELSVERLTRALQDGRRRVRLNAVRALQALGEAGSDAEAALLLALKDGEHRIRIAALDALAAVGRPAPLEEALEGPTPGRNRPEPVREALVADPEKLGEAPVSILITLLDDGRPEVRSGAAAELGSRGSDGGAAAPALAGRARDGDARVRRAALDALVAVGGVPEHSAAMIAALRDDEDAGCRAAAAAALAEDSDGLVGALTGHPTFVQAAIMPLVMGRSDADALLLRGASHPSVTARINAALGVYRRRKGPALEALLDDGVLEVRAVARAGLRGLMRTDGRPGHDQLIPGLVGRWAPPGRPPPEVSGAAPQEAPGPVGLPPVSEATPAQLVILLRDSDPEIRRDAARAVGATAAGKDPDAVAELAAAVDDNDAEVRAAARQAVAGVSAQALTRALAAGEERFARVLAERPDALAILVAGTESEASPVRRGAVHAMAELGREDAAGARVRLLELQGDGDTEVRDAAKAALRMLAERHRPQATVREAQALPIDQWDSELLDDKTLKACADKTGVDGLLGALQDGRELVRANAARALGFLGKDGRPAAAMLMLALKDSAQPVRSAAADAIGRLKLPLDEAAPALLFALSRSGPEVAEAVSDALVRYGKAGVQAVVDALADRGLDVERSVERVARARHAEFVGPLTDALQTDSAVVRRNAADVLAALGPYARDAEPALAERLDDPDFSVKLSAVRALGRLGDIDDRNVFKLMDIVRDDPNVSMVIAAKEAFRYLGMGWRIPG